MKNIFLSFALLLLIFSCKKEVTTKPVTKTPTEIVVSDNVQKKCFSFEGNGSKVELQLEQNGTEAKGSLTYLLAEKDSNTGTFTGKIENNILIAEYTFQSEGTESTRQVAFEFKDNQWIEGYGELTEDGTYFKNISKIKFNSTMPLSKVDCSK